MARGSGCAAGDAAAVAAAAAPGAMKDGQLGVGKADSMSAQYSLLSTTNDSRLRVYDLDNFAMVRLHDCVPFAAVAGSCGHVDWRVYVCARRGVGVGARHSCCGLRT